MLPWIGRDGLHDAIQGASNQYKKLVLNEHVIYERFALDYLNSHTYHDAIDAWSKNEHCKILGIIKTLLFDRIDLVKIYFTASEITEEAFDNLIKELTIIPADGKDRFPSVPTFGCYFNQTTIEIMTQAINDLKMFNEKVTANDVNDLFNCIKHQPRPLSIRSRKNFLVAGFFNGLYIRKILPNNWQHVLSFHGLILSSSGKKVMTANDFSSSLSRLKGDYPNSFNHLNEWLNIIEESTK